MDESLRRDRSRVFSEVADVYDRARPGYPAEAVRWLVGSGQSRVLELGAGTGKLTTGLVAAGHQVLASDVSGPMLGHVRAGAAGAWLVQGAAERIPLRTSAVDVVVAAQSFHWFDHDQSVPEMARVLVAGGHVGLVWNSRDESVPWVRRLSGLIGSEGLENGPGEALAKSGLFEPPERRRFRFWQRIDREQLIGLVRSRSYVAALDEGERSALLEKVGALYDEYGRGSYGMAMPYVTDCFRARVNGLAKELRERAPWDEGLLIDFT